MSKKTRDILSFALLVALGLVLFGFYSSAEAALNINGYTIDQFDSSQTYAFGDITLESGDWIVLARNCDQAAFEAYWGVSLPADAIFINGSTSVPQINGAETYQLKDATDTVIDGPTAVAMTVGSAVQRTSPGADATQATSWTVVSESNADPAAGLGTRSNAGLVITEYADATGTGNFIYEYVELYYDEGPTVVNFAGISVKSPLRFVWLGLAGILVCALIVVRRLK